MPWKKIYKKKLINIAEERFSHNSAYSLLQLFTNEGLEHIPHDIEHEGLFHHMDLFQSQRHCVLNEAQKQQTE